MICPNCGKIYKDSKDSCPRCGMPNGVVIDESRNSYESRAIERTPVIEKQTPIENQSQGYRPMDQGITSQDDNRSLLSEMEDTIRDVEEKFQVLGGTISSETTDQQGFVDTLHDDTNSASVPFGKETIPASQIVSNDNRVDYVGRPDVDTSSTTGQPPVPKFGCGVAIVFLIANQLLFYIPGIATYVSMRKRDPEYAKKVLALTIVQLIVGVAAVVLLALTGALH